MAPREASQGCACGGGQSWCFPFGTKSSAVLVTVASAGGKKLSIQGAETGSRSLKAQPDVIPPNEQQAFRFPLAVGAVVTKDTEG